MDHEITHPLDIAAAKSVLDAAFASYKTRYSAYNPTLRWGTGDRADFSFKAAGFTLRGVMRVMDGKITVTLDVPFLLRAFKKQAIDVIDREVKFWLAQAAS